MSAPALRVAVVGAGILGRRHARVFSELPDTELVAVCSRTLAHAEEVATPRGARAGTDLDQLLRETACDVVAVATPDHLHLAPVLTALAHGCHVLVEKPLAISASDALAMVAAAAARHLVLQVNYSQRFVPEFAWIRQQVQAGVIGVPRMVVSAKQDTIFVPTKMISWAADTTPLFFMTSHELDLMAWFLDARVVSVAAHEQRGVLERRGIHAHDGVDALVRYDSGATGAFHTSWIHPESWPSIVTERFDIIGESGVIHWENNGRRVDCYAAEKGQTRNFTGPQTATEVDGRIEGAFKTSLQLFCNAVRTGEEPITSAARTLHVTATQLAILDAMRSGETVPVPPLLIDEPLTT